MESVAGTYWDVLAKGLFQSGDRTELGYYKTERVHHPALAEPNTKHWELQWRNGYFINEWHHPEEQEANIQKPKLPDGM